MNESRRTTVYLEVDLHKALRLKAIETDSNISDLINDAVRQSMIEDAEDAAAFMDRAAEASIPYGDFVMKLRREGKL